MRRHVFRFCAAAIAAALLARPAAAAEAAQPSGLSADALRRIDAAAAEVLGSTHVPGASIAVVRGGRVAYAQAYGAARIEPQVPASPATRYAIGSISKQFTAAALLLLQEDGRLSLDDRVGKFLPELTRAGDITLRQLLSHTSGYQDYWPQDYVFPTMLEPVLPQGVTDRWARRPLDYEPSAVYPDDGVAIVVLVNQDASRAAEQLEEKLDEIVFAAVQATDARRTAQARGIFDGLQQGRLDRQLFAENANYYFSEQTIADFEASLAPLGALRQLRQVRTWLRGGMTGRSYDATFADRTLRVWTYEMPDGRLEQFQVAVKE